MRRTVLVGMLITGVAATVEPAFGCAPQTARQQSEPENHEEPDQRLLL